MVLPLISVDPIGSCPSIAVRPQVLEEDTLVGWREGSELAHAGRGGWMHRKKHSKCFCVGVDSNSFRENKEVRLLHSMITACITFLFLDNLTCWQRLAHRAGTVSLPPCGPTTEHGPIVSAFNCIVNGNHYHQFITKCYLFLKCKFGKNQL